MRRFSALLLVTTCGWAATIGPAYAAGSSSKEPVPNWQQRDTAMYVVSTLNMVRSPGGKLFTQRVGAGSYDVYADSANDNLFFIQLKSAGGAKLGAVAYQMGWAKPQSVTRFSVRAFLKRAAITVLNAYRNDDKQLIGSFTSTFPTR